jgi:hypothetical protein
MEVVMGKELIRKLDDTEIDNIKINSKDHFELVYLRHRYFRKSTNPTAARLGEFEEMICNISDKIYLRNITVFKTLGMEMDDLRNIGRIHTVSFISMGGIKENPDLFEQLRVQHKAKYGNHSEPGDKDIFLKEHYNLSRFLNQRLQEVAKFSKNKNENIRGTRSYRNFYIGNSEKDPEDMDLIKNYKDHGYSKITESEYKKIAKENKCKGQLRFENKEGQIVRAVYIQGSFLTSNDIDGSELDPRRNSFYRSAEKTLMIKEALFDKKKGRKKTNLYTKNK